MYDVTDNDVCRVSVIVYGARSGPRPALLPPSRASRVAAQPGCRSAQWPPRSRELSLVHVPAKMTLPAGTFLRLKRSAADAALDELSVVLPVAKRERRSVPLLPVCTAKSAADKVGGDEANVKSGSASVPERSAEVVPRKPRKLRFRRLPPEKTLRKPGRQLATETKRKFIDLHMSAVLRSVALTPQLACNGVAMARSSEFVYDIFAPVEDSDEIEDEKTDEKANAGRRIACIDSALLPAELFGEIDDEDDIDDDPYSDDEERSVDYPSTPESSEDELGQSGEDELSVSSSFEDRAMGYSTIDRYTPFGVPSVPARSRRRFAYDVMSDSEEL